MLNGSSHVFELVEGQFETCRAEKDQCYGNLNTIGLET